MAPRPSVPHKKGYVEANGVNYYYEVHGRGQPLLLLHGGLGSIDMFGPVLPLLAKQRQVIGVDLHGHGRTALGERAISLIDMGDDMATLVKKLGHDTVDVLGYSLGGGVAFRLAVQHPALVRRLAILPDVTHYEAFMAPSMAATVLPFLNGKSNAPSWAGQVQQKK